MTAKIISAPADLASVKSPSLFLAGGITNCPNWQADMIGLLKESGLTILNPRRPDFPIGDPSAAAKQIAWEHDALRAADKILFWFCAETLCPIVLYELGAWSMTDKPLFVGLHPAYARKQDVVVQTGLARPDVPVVESSFEALASQVLDDLDKLLGEGG